MDDQQASRLEDMQTQVARLEMEISRFKDKETQSQIEQLKKQNQHDKEAGENQLLLSLLKQENEQLQSERVALQGRIDKATRDLALAGPANPPRGPQGPGTIKNSERVAGTPSEAQVDLPPEIKEDGSECKDCATPFVGRLTKCIDGNCKQGFVTLRVRSGATRSKVPVKFPCPSCMGLGRMPCVTCRKADHGFTLAQKNHVGTMIKKDSAEWIRAVGFIRQRTAAQSALSRSRRSSLIVSRAEAAERLAYQRQISSAEAAIAKINEKRLEIAYAIGKIYNRAFEASLRNIPTSEQAALRRKGAKAIDTFNELFIRGFYH